MWVEVIKPFGSALEGELLEVKDDGQHQLLIDRGLIKKVNAPEVEEVTPVTTGAYSTSNVLNSATNAVVEPAKRGPKAKQ